jgi:hypothetical protein
MPTRHEVTAIPRDEALRLLRRAAPARGISWPSDPRAVAGVGGLEGDFTDRPGTEKAVWGTLNGKDGLLVLFSGDRPIAWGDKQLAAITAVQPVVLPGLPTVALMVDDRNDQMVGAFLAEERRRIYVWDGRGLREAWRGLLSSEQYRHARWQNPRGPNLWRLDRITGQVTLRGTTLEEMIRTQQLEAPGSAQAPIPPSGSFRVVSEKDETRRFRWDARLRRFEPA